MNSHKAFAEAVSALSRDMPILMHGSGDVLPDQVNPDTVQLISELTARYISNLVDAAIDAQQLLAGGQATRPPPPRYPRSRKPPLPFLPAPADKKKSDKDDDHHHKAAVGLKKRPRRPDVDYWDEPLPVPKIKKSKSRAVTEASASGDAQEKSAAGDKLSEEDEQKPVHIDQWVGAVGVDLWEQSRSRAAFVRMPDAVGVQCFIFPICHDGFLYGKVMQVQASRRAIAPVLVDSVLLDLVRTEGALARKHAPRRKKTASNKSAKDSGDADVEDEPEQEEDEMPQDDGAAWPGLEYLLPVHTITEAMADGSS